MTLWSAAGGCVRSPWCQQCPHPTLPQPRRRCRACGPSTSMTIGDCIETSFHMMAVVGVTTVCCTVSSLQAAGACKSIHDCRRFVHAVSTASSGSAVVVSVASLSSVALAQVGTLNVNNVMGLVEAGLLPEGCVRKQRVTRCLGSAHLAHVRRTVTVYSRRGPSKGPLGGVGSQ